MFSANQKSGLDSRTSVRLVANSCVPAPLPVHSRGLQPQSCRTKTSFSTCRIHHHRIFQLKCSLCSYLGIAMFVLLYSQRVLSPSLQTISFRSFGSLLELLRSGDYRSSSRRCLVLSKVMRMSGPRKDNSQLKNASQFVDFAARYTSHPRL